jgi:hypothetical protein
LIRAEKPLKSPPIVTKPKKKKGGGGKPFQSALEKHFDTIRSLRRGRKTWVEVAKILNEQGAKCTPQGVWSFFNAAVKRKRPPLGFEGYPYEKSEAKSAPKPPVLPAFPTSEPDDFSIKVEQDNEDPFASYDPTKTKE